MKANEKSYVHKLSHWPEVIQPVNGGCGSGIPTQACLWQSGHLTTIQGWIEKWLLGLAEAHSSLCLPELLIRRSSHFIFSGWASKVKRRWWTWLVSRFLSFWVAFRHHNRASESTLWSINTQCLWGGGLGETPLWQCRSPLHATLFETKYVCVCVSVCVCVCVCVFMSFLIWFLKKINEIDNLLFLHVSFLHFGFKFKFYLILHSLSWNHSC